jgi:F0F1-type ATP synthase membrane subunit c/vacuolar-type H+-ATPase subunit K
MDTQKTTKRRPPIHHFGSILTIILDWLWFVVELLEPLSIERPLVILAIIGGSFITGLIGVSVLQRYSAHDGWRNSIFKGLVMGLAVAVPYPVVGTFVGVILLGTARIYWKAPSEQEPE